MIPAEISARMRLDWNTRAREDARYFASGRHRHEDEAEFWASGVEAARKELEPELARLAPAVSSRSRRALEIGCGPGRLMRPMSHRFGEIHGVDVSDEMVRLARLELASIPHAHVAHNQGADLAAYADQSFDFVYSLGVFAHLPAHEVVQSYFREVARVLRPGGLFRCQLNGLSRSGEQGDTWEGVAVAAQEVRAFTREHGLRLLALGGVSTRSLWTTWQAPGEEETCFAGTAHIRRIANALSGEPLVPRRGRYATVTLWIEGLPSYADLNRLEIGFGGIRAVASCLGLPEPDGLRPVRCVLPPDVETGLVPVRLHWEGEPLGDAKTLRVIPAPPAIPRILSITDSRHPAAQRQTRTRSLRVVAEEITAPDQFEARIDGQPVSDLEVTCADPVPARFEFTFAVPEEVEAGSRPLVMQLGSRRFSPIAVHIS